VNILAIRDLHYRERQYLVIYNKVQLARAHIQHTAHRAAKGDAIILASWWMEDAKKLYKEGREKIGKNERKEMCIFN
jgi:hypothetical protein